MAEPADQAGLLERIAEVLRTAAFDCDGACGKPEEQCIAEHPVQVAAWTHGIVSHVWGPADELAAAVLPLVQQAVTEQTEQLHADRDRLAAEVQQLWERAEQETEQHDDAEEQAAKATRAALKTARTHDWHQAEAEAERARLAAEVAELRARLAEYDRTRAAVTEGAPLGRALTASDVLVQHDVTRKALADALGTGWHLNWAQLVDAAKRSHQANTEWQRDATELRARLADAEEGITAAVQHRKRAEDRAQRAEKRIQAVTEAAILWRDRPGGDVGLAIALASILDTEQPEPPAATAMVRVLRECDRIEREVYGQHDEDDDGKREAVRRIRTALDGTGEAPGPWVVRKICCGSDDGTVEFPTWTEADNFREIYIDSARIAGHERSAIIRAKEAATGE